MGNTNSFFWMPGAVDTRLAAVRDDVPHGTLTKHAVSGNGHAATATRTVHLYQPPTSDPAPLLVVLDGGDFLRKAHLATVVDNLIAEHRIVPIAMALVDHGDVARVEEYACNDATVALIARDVLPFAGDRLNLLDGFAARGTFGMMGASMGGLMSLYTALRIPEVFGKVLCESGAFDSDRLYYRSVLYDLLACRPPPPVKIWMDVGKHEWFLEPNRKMYGLLRERGYDVTYFEQNSGHNYPSWRNVLWRGLEHLYGPDPA